MYPIENMFMHTRQLDIAINSTIKSMARKMMVGAAGFEPATPWSQTRCATRLRQAPPTSGSHTFSTENYQANLRHHSEIISF